MVAVPAHFINGTGYGWFSSERDTAKVVMLRFGGSLYLIDVFISLEPRRKKHNDISDLVSDDGDPAYRVDADIFCDDILCVLHMGTRT